MIELDEMLNGNPTWEQVQEFWEKAAFPEEHHLIAAIKKHLRTPEQKASMDTVDLSIAEMLNGRYGGWKEPLVQEIYADWNQRLGFKAFGW